jgi:hypothetical protein
MLHSKLHFHRHVDCLHSQALIIPFISYIFSSLDSLEVLYITLIRSKLVYASVVWNNLTLADSNKLENIQSLQIYVIIDLFSPNPFVIMDQC